MKNKEIVKEHIRRLFEIAKELERLTQRPFPLDGHTLGSIGEVYAKIYYGVSLHKPSHKGDDGVWNEKSVQVKCTQRDRSICLKGETDLLLVLQIMDDGNFKEVYNGNGRDPWNLPNRYGELRKVNKAGERIIPLRELRELNNRVINKIPRK